MLNSLILHLNNAVVAIAAKGDGGGKALHGWGSFKQTLDNFFQTGLGGDGAKGIGGAIVVIGIICAIVSFALHHFNPQSRFPGWFMCLVVAIVGSLLLTGIKTPMTIIGNIRDWLVSTVAG